MYIQEVLILVIRHTEIWVVSLLYKILSQKKQIYVLVKLILFVSRFIFMIQNMKKWMRLLKRLMQKDNQKETRHKSILFDKNLSQDIFMKPMWFSTEFHIGFIFFAFPSEKSWKTSLRKIEGIILQRYTGGWDNDWQTERANSQVQTRGIRVHTDFQDDGFIH